jgi:hypothetical protein
MKENKTHPLLRRCFQSVRWLLDEQKGRKVRQVISAADDAELEKHYSFVLPSTSNSIIRSGKIAWLNTISRISTKNTY